MGISVESIVEAGRRCMLTGHVLQDWAKQGTPKQREYLLGYLMAERASRDAARKANLMRQCGLPQRKSLEGYDFSAIGWPEGFGREDLLSLRFMEAAEDLVLMGDVGTGKTHMAIALCELTCQRLEPARFFTASALVMRLRRARDEGKLDRELQRLLKAKLLVIDELGFLPLDVDGARLLFQVVAQGYERQSLIITTNLEFSRWSETFGDAKIAAAVLDRVCHHGRLITFRGESYRTTHALMSGKGVVSKP